MPQCKPERLVGRRFVGRHPGEFEQGLVGVDESGGHAEFLGESFQFGQMVPDGGLRGECGRQGHDLAVHERIAVAVAADP